MTLSPQEFCLLAVMGLLADYFLQLFFFVTVLSMDMTQLELSDVLRKPVHGNFAAAAAAGVGSRSKLFRTPVSGPGLFKSHKDGTSVLAPSCNGDSVEAVGVTVTQAGGNISGCSQARRVKLMGFFAKKRFIQRLFVLSMLFWSSFFIYQGEIWQNLLKQHEFSLRPELPEKSPLTRQETGRQAQKYQSTGKGIFTTRLLPLTLMCIVKIYTTFNFIV